MDVVRAIDILYAIGERELIASGLAEIGERSTDMATLAAVGKIAAHHKDARAMVLLGKTALGRGLPLEQMRPSGSIMSRGLLGGLHHQYVRV
jgi:soluble lytic murein transglycosylase